MLHTAAERETATEGDRGGEGCTSTVTSHVESSPSRAFVVVSCQVAGREHRSACAAPHSAVGGLESTLVAIGVHTCCTCARRPGAGTSRGCSYDPLVPTSVPTSSNLATHLPATQAPLAERVIPDQDFYFLRLRFFNFYFYFFRPTPEIFHTFLIKYQSSTYQVPIN